MREEEQQASASSVAMRWQSGSKLGGQVTRSDGQTEAAISPEQSSFISPHLIDIHTDPHRSP